MDAGDLRSFLPTSFGKKPKKKNLTALHSGHKRKLPPTLLEPAAVAKKQPRLAESGAAQEDQPAPETKQPVDEGKQAVDTAKAPLVPECLSDAPLGYEATLEGHKGVVSTLSLDKSGARLLSGGMDYNICMWEFNSMNSSLKPFRELEPDEGHIVTDLAFSRKGDSFLCCTGGWQAHLYDRDGRFVSQCTRGDMYLFDLRHTKGHVNVVTGCAWHPQDKTKYATCSLDATVRLWDIHKEKNLEVMRMKTPQPKRWGITALAWASTNSLIAAACTDGSIQFWHGKGPRLRVCKVAKNAHTPHSETSGLVFCKDGRTLVSRGTLPDDTVKKWDVRNLSSAVDSVSGVGNSLNSAGISFSPDERFILTGTSPERTGTNKFGELVFVEHSSMQVVHRMPLCTRAVLNVLWHPKLNQLLVACADGTVRILYDPTHSRNGALLCVGRAARREAPFEDVEHLDIVNPHALPLFRREPSRRRNRDLVRMDSTKSQRPQPPLSFGPGEGGRLGRSRTQYVMETMPKDPRHTENPREALLKFDKLAKKDTMWTLAYKVTQPKSVFQKNKKKEEES